MLMGKEQSSPAAEVKEGDDFQHVLDMSKASFSLGIIPHLALALNS